MSTHAPTPWVAVYAPHAYRDAIEIMDAESATVATVTRGYEDGPSWTNARLIAAAPDLLEALVSAMAVEVGAKTSFYMAEAWKNGAPMPENIEWSRWFLAARAAIAKAKGEGP